MNFEEITIFTSVNITVIGQLLYSVYFELFKHRNGHDKLIQIVETYPDFCGNFKGFRFEFTKIPVSKIF